VTYIVNIVFLTHFSFFFVAILREVHYKGYITEFFFFFFKCKVLSFKKTYILNMY
jgi:hypothetical protein